MEANAMKISSILTGILLVCMMSGSAFAQGSLYRDIKANKVGDIITVILMENISGSSKSDARTASSSDGSASGSASGNFLPFEPTFGSGVKVNYDSDQSDIASQRQLLEGFMSVQIIEKTPSGDLIVEGDRTTQINGETHQMSLTGTVRPSDVDSKNQVLSYRVANANISYEKSGGIAELKKKRGLIKRIIFTGVGIGLGAAIMMGATK